ncbi:MAG: hypothetical protein WBN75_00785 [Verrucomicrobiia bacterium]
MEDQRKKPGRVKTLSGFVDEHDKQYIFRIHKPPSLALENLNLPDVGDGYDGRLFPVAPF